jgi:hypothetical protein|nr:MAG TPA: protein of unknown function (DUF2213) [Caudoviricetes sp.]
MFNWGLRQDTKAVNAIILGEGSEKGRPFKARFLQAGLVKYDFGVCLLQKETIDKFIDTFKGCPVIINHKDNITESDKVGVVQNIWFSEQDGWFWCDGVLTDDKAVELVENGYNVSCQYAITDYSNNTEKKLHNGNPYDKEILDGVFEHLAIVNNPRYEGAYIAVNAYIAQNAIARNDDEDIDWITVKGNHIPIEEGETKKEAVEKFIDKVRKKKASKTTDTKEKKNTTSEKEKQISKDYALMRSKDFVKSIDGNPKAQKEILFTNVDDTWLLTYSWKKGEEGWDLVKAGKVIQHFNDKAEAYEAHSKGYFEDIDAMDKEKTFDEKRADIRPVKIKKSEIPQFENKKELSNWMKSQFEQLGSVKIDDTGIDLKLSAGRANREAIKRRATKEENKAVVAKFKEIVSQSIKKDEREADDRHKKDQEVYYNKFQIDGEDYEVEIFVDMPYGTDKNSYYAGHSAAKIKIAPRDTMNVSNDLTHYAKSANFIIPYLEIDFNPNATIKAINKYQPVFDWIRNFKGGTMDKETKGLFESLIEALKARNEADDDKEKEDDKKAENKKAKNEDVDKRKLIDEVAGIMKSAGADDELIRTAIAKMEKLAYDKSEAGTADNKAKNEDEEGKDKDAENKCKNKCKNEDDGEKKEKEEKYEELKEEVKKEAENKKAKNSMDALKRVFFEGEAPRGKIYMSQKEGIELGRKLY